MAAESNPPEEPSSQSVLSSASLPSSPSVDSIPSSTNETEPPAKKKRPSFDLFDIYGDKEPTNDNSADSIDSIESIVDTEMKNYEKMKVHFGETHIHFNVLQWWHLNENMFPLLSKFARFVHSIPASSAPSERAFSTAGNMLTNKRSSMLPETLGSMLMLRSNWDLRNHNQNG